MRGAIPPLPSTPSWRGAQLKKHKDNFTTVSSPALGPLQPPIRWVPGSLSLGLKRPGSEADQSPPSSAEVKNVWSYTSAPQYAFMEWCLVKSQGQLYFYLYIYLKVIFCTSSAEIILFVDNFHTHNFTLLDRCKM